MPQFDVVDMALENVPEQQVMGANEEVQLKITSLKLGVSSKENLILKVSTNIVTDDPDADFKPVYISNLVVPTTQHTRQEANRYLRSIARFCECFKLKPKVVEKYIASSVNVINEMGADEVEPMEEAKDRIGKVIIGVSSYEGEDRNEVRQFLTE